IFLQPFRSVLSRDLVLWTRISRSAPRAFARERPLASEQRCGDRNSRPRLSRHRNCNALPDRRPAAGDEHVRIDHLGFVRRFIFWHDRVLQLGVLLLAAGTILGGVWANYSWGRFWGWDPKETWALIALLCYLTALHGRLAGWWTEFGLVVASVICFLAVLMAWYGV